MVADRALIATLCGIRQRLEGALALVSGRTLASLDRLFNPHRFAAVGAHGAEVRLQSGEQRRAIIDTFPHSALQKLRVFASAAPGLLVEEKAYGAALHYRLAPNMADRCQRFMSNLVDTLDCRYRLVTGNRVVEIAPSGHDKGTGVQSLLADEIFAGRRPIFVGDDEPDEPAFQAVNDLGGTSIRVGQSAFSAARYCLDDVVGVRAWLQQSVSPASCEYQGSISSAQR